MRLLSGLKIGETFRPYKVFIGSFVPEWLECRTEISHAAKLVYGRMCRYEGKNGECKARQNEMAKAVGMKPRQFRNHIDELIKNKLIKKIRSGQGKSNRYQFLVHKWIFDWQYLASQSKKQNDRQDIASISSNEWQDSAALDRQDSACHYKGIVKENQIRESNSVNGLNGNENLNAIVKLIYKKLLAAPDGFKILDEIAMENDAIAAAVARETHYVLSRFKECGFNQEIKKSWSFHLRIVGKFVAADQIFILKRILAEILANRDSLKNPGAVYNMKIQECAKKLGIDLELKHPNAKAPIIPKQIQERKVA